MIGPAVWTTTYICCFMYMLLLICNTWHPIGSLCNAVQVQFMVHAVQVHAVQVIYGGNLPVHATINCAQFMVAIAPATALIYFSVIIHVYAPLGQHIIC